MSGIICCVCLPSASHFRFYSLYLSNDKTSSTRIRRRTCHSLIATHDQFNSEDAFGRVFFNQTRGGPLVDIKVLENLLRETIDQWNLIDRYHQVIQKRIIFNLGFLKSGWVELRCPIDRGNLRKFLGMHRKKLTFIVRNLYSAGMRSLQGTERRFTMDRGNLRKWITKKRFIPKISSWAVMQQS